MFLLLGVFYIRSKYLGWLQKLQLVLEILFLFIAVEPILVLLGLSAIFPVNHLVSLIVLYGFVIRLRKSAPGVFFIQAGSIRGSILLATVFSFLSLLFLSWWFRELAANPYARSVPDFPLHFLLPLGIGFAVANSLYEEGVFRSIFFSYFKQLFPPWIALTLQSLWFSFMHYQSGFPAGISGMIMTFIFGIMMGVLVKRSRGLLLAVVVHAVADFWIFLLVVLRMWGKF